jgi:hypothetical protein
MKLQLPRRGDSSDMSFIEFVDRFVLKYYKSIDFSVEKESSEKPALLHLQTKSRFSKN